MRFSSQRRLARLIDTYLRRITLGCSPALRVRPGIDDPRITVAAGDAWAITTPYGLLQAGDNLERIDVHPLPAPGLSRTIVLGARGAELLNIPDKLAQRIVVWPCAAPATPGSLASPRGLFPPFRTFEFPEADAHQSQNKAIPWAGGINMNL